MHEKNERKSYAINLQTIEAEYEVKNVIITIISRP